MGICLSICSEADSYQNDNTEKSIEDFRDYIRNKNKLHEISENKSNIIGRFKNSG